MSNDQQIADDWAAALAEQALEESAHLAPLEELTDDSSPIGDDERRKLDTILDIPVTISMEVGRTQISIRNLLQLNQARWWNWTAWPVNHWTYWLTAP